MVVISGCSLPDNKKQILFQLRVAYDLNWYSWINEIEEIFEVCSGLSYETRLSVSQLKRLQDDK